MSFLHLCLQALRTSWALRCVTINMVTQCFQPCSFRCMLMQCTYRSLHLNTHCFLSSTHRQPVHAMFFRHKLYDLVILHQACCLWALHQGVSLPVHVSHRHHRRRGLRQHDNLRYGECPHCHLTCFSHHCPACRRFNFLWLVEFVFVCYINTILFIHHTNTSSCVHHWSFS